MPTNIRLDTVLTFIFISLLYRPSPANAAVVHVPEDFQTIQAAINSAADRDTVLVQPGTYKENIDYGGKKITVGSLYLRTGDTTYISQTIIDGNRSGSVVTFQHGEDSTALLTGFTITNGSGKNYGGGIFCGYSNPVLTNLAIIWNSADIGAGIYFDHSNPSLVNVLISNNSTSDISVPNGSGGGIECSYSKIRLTNVLIANNVAKSGGGIALVWSSGVFINVTISGNQAGRGGGIRFYNATLLIENSIIWNSPSPEYEGSYLMGHFNFIYCYYSNIRGGQASFNYYNTRLYWQTGNINLDPRFIESDDHPYMLSKFSPCINAGDTSGKVLPLLDLANNPRMHGGIIDMGAYEYQGGPEINNPPIADFFISPNTGTTSTVFQFDATGSNDVEDSSSTLDVRWDWEDDGVWDTGYSSEQIITHQFSDTGEFCVRLEVKDSGNFKTSITRNVRVFLALDKEIFVMVESDRAAVLVPFQNMSLSLQFISGTVGRKILRIIGHGVSVPESIHDNETFDKVFTYLTLGSESINTFNAVLSILYTDSLLNDTNISQDNLIIAYWDSTSNMWRALPTTVDAENNIASTIIDHFSLWALTDKTDDLIVNVEEYEGETIPEEFRLRQNYPNPFNPVTFIRFSLPKEERVRITLYNILGQKVRSLANEPFSPGEHTVAWDGRDDSGGLLASGVYIYEIRAGEFIERKKMTLLR